MFTGRFNRFAGSCLFCVTLLIGACESRTLAPISVFDANPDERPEPATTFVGRTTIVKAGDNLYSIAFEAGFHTQDVARWNNMNQDDPIYVGQSIRLYPPPGEQPVTNTAPKSQTSAAKVNTAPTNLATPELSDWVWPTRGTIISSFSATQRRNGIEIAGQSGTPILSAANGRVVYAGTGLIGFGRIIIVKHSEQFLSVYAHNSRLVVTEGDIVNQGQKIAEMGQTDADRVKLHFEIRRNGKPVNPLSYLPKG